VFVYFLNGGVSYERRHRPANSTQRRVVYIGIVCYVLHACTWCGVFALRCTESVRRTMDFVSQISIRFTTRLSVPARCVIHEAKSVISLIVRHHIRVYFKLKKKYRVYIQLADGGTGTVSNYDSKNSVAYEFRRRNETERFCRSPRNGRENTFPVFIELFTSRRPALVRTFLGRSVTDLRY